MSAAVPGVFVPSESQPEGSRGMHTDALLLHGHHSTDAAAQGTEGCVVQWEKPLLQSCLAV